MSTAVADRVLHPLPRPIKCDCCGSPRVNLQKRGFMGLRVYSEWDLVWHCLDCNAMVGCHKGTDIPLGTMADAPTREARFLAHKAFDRLWRGRRLERAAAYRWMATVLAIPFERAHIGMLDEAQCIALMVEVKNYDRNKAKADVHWQQRTRRKRNK